MSGRIMLHPEVRSALAAGQPVVALESTILAHGLPAPDNLRIGHEIEAVVRSHGVRPATIAVLDGEIRVGLDATGLERVCGAGDLAKLGVRDLAPAVALRRDGATTVASTATIAARCGIGVFATGGLGGVHRCTPLTADGAEQVRDESADLHALAVSPLAVVCSGVKSILDVGATLERLETLSVPVLGYRTNRFAGFYLTDSGHDLDWRVDTPEEVAAVLAARDGLGGATSAVVVANPVSPDDQLDPALHDRALRSALAGVSRDGVVGKDVTPYLLDHFHRATAGASLRVNTAVILGNARLAARIALARAATGR